MSEVCYHKTSDAGLLWAQPIAGRRFVGILGVEKVGNYAIRIMFDDLHSSGIYSWPFLHALGVNKYQRIKAYIRHLREHGLNRDPRQTRHYRACRRP